VKKEKDYKFIGQDISHENIVPNSKHLSNHHMAPLATALITNFRTVSMHPSRIICPKRYFDVSMYSSFHPH